jgi:hypothetical protein
MPLKEFQIWIDGFTFIRARRLNEGGDILSFAVVLMAFDGDIWVDIARFDTSHGQAHQDVLGKKQGLFRKIWYRDLEPDEVFEFAIELFRNEHASIREQFFRN